MTVTHRLYAALGRVIAARRDGRLARMGARAALAYLDYYERPSCNIDRNGEARVLRIVSDGAQTIFDVGANVGDSTRRALQSSPGATVHAFEIVPRIADELGRGLSGVGDRLVVNRYGIADVDGAIAAKVYSGFSELSTITDYDHGDDFVWQELPVRRGDTYVREAAVDHIDFPEDRR